MSRLKSLSAENILLFFVFLFLPTQLGKHFWPDSSYIFSIKIDYLSPTVYFWDLLLIGLVGVWFFKKPKINYFALKLLVIYLLSQALSFTSAINIQGGWVRLEQLILFSLFALYLSSQNLEFLKRIKLPLMLALFGESILVLLEFATGGSLNLWLLGERSFSLSTPSIATFNWYGQVFLRPYATFPHPNVMAAFMVLVSPLILVAPSPKYLEKKAYFRWLTLFASSLSVVLSFSRASLLILLFEGINLFKTRVRIFLIIMIVLLPLLYVRFESAFNFDNLSIIRREELAGIALTQFGQSPFTGVGLNNFINQIAISNLVSGTSRFFQPVHNIFLLTLSETGIIGLLIFLLFLLLPILKLWQRRKTPLSKVLLFSIATICFLGMFDHYFLTLPQGQRLLFMVWGLSMLEFK